MGIYVNSNPFSLICQEIYYERTRWNLEIYEYFWLLGDHLGSTSMVTDASGVMVSEVRYSAFGETRYQSGTLSTDYLYTGQRQEAEIGLYYYVARWYDPAIGRFIQADTLIPNVSFAQSWDRYAYTYNNPIKYNDPTGHCPWCIGAAIGGIVGGIVGAVTYIATNEVEHRTNTGLWTAVAGGAVGGALVGSGLGLIAGAAGTVSAASAGLTMATGTAAMEVASSTSVSVLIGAGSGAIGSGTAYMVANQNEFNTSDYTFTTLLGGASGAASGWIPKIDGITQFAQYSLHALNGAATSNAQYVWDASRDGTPITSDALILYGVLGGMTEGVFGSLIPDIDGAGSLSWLNIPKRAAYTTAAAGSINALSKALTTVGTSLVNDKITQKYFIE